MVIEWLISVIAFCSFIYIVYYIIERFFTKKDFNNIDDEDDIFFDNAPLPKSPSPLPPVQTSENIETLEQMQFKAFMKKMKEEKEKEKAAILRE